MRQIHYNDAVKLNLPVARLGELFTTFHDWPDGYVVEVSVRDEEDMRLLDEIVKRFNAYERLKALLGAYVEDDENNDMDDSELYAEASALLLELEPRGGDETE